MLESLAAWVLNTYIGEYLENLNTDQLSVALLQGQVELENVPLKKTALRKFDIPVAVKAGVLGKLTLRVPLTHLRSEPWQVQISDLYVLLEPCEHKYDIEFDEQYLQTKKQQQLEALESFHKKQLITSAGLELTHDLQSPTEPSGSGWFTYGASLVSLIVENIQLTLTNVHIRFEDDVTLGDGNSFVSGIKIKRVGVQTTNQFWIPRFMQRIEDENLFKSLELEGLSIYWNSGVTVSHPVTTVRELASMLGIESVRENSYILFPVSTKVRMERNCSKFPLKSKPAIPRFKFEIEPDSVAIEMSKQQLAEVRFVTKEWARYDRARLYRKWRPSRELHGNAVLWWKFAFQCHLEQIQKRNECRSWNFALTRAKLMNVYCRAYKRRLNASLETAFKAKSQSETGETTENPPSPGKEEADSILMKQIERDPQYCYEDLHILRDAVFRNLLKVESSFNKATEGLVTDEQFVSLTSLDSSSFLTPTEGSIASSSSMNKIEKETNNDNVDSGAGGGLYSWLSSWFSAESEVVDKTLTLTSSDDDKVSGTSALPGFLEIHELPPHLREVEKHLEEEILDVLNESWDDSTVLRRDAMLAKISLKMNSMTLRFVDESPNLRSDAVTTKVLAAELSDIFGEVRLSPRHHTVGFSLTVGDFGIHSEEFNSSVSDKSLFWSSGIVSMFALGKSANVKQKLTAEMPLLRFVYERRAPGLVAQHLLDAQLAPISIMYHEDALTLLAQFFESSSPIKTDDLFDVPIAVEENVVSDLRTQMSFSFRIPNVSIELRSAALLLGDECGLPLDSIGGAGRAFACAHFENVQCEVRKLQEFVTEIEVLMAGLKVEDLLEGEHSPTMKHLLRTTGYSNICNNFPASNSCPDLTTLEPSGFVSSSLPVEQNIFSEVRPVTPTITISDHPVQPRVIERKNSLHALSQSDRSCSISVTLIHPNHSKFESKYKKVGCIVRTRFSELELGMNRQTWTLMLDFLGVIGGPPPSETVNLIQKDHRKEVHFEAANLVLAMNKPLERCQLGRMTLEQVSALIQIDIIGFKLCGTCTALSLEDLTPLYSDLYPQRARAIADPSTETKLELCFYGTPDPNLLREFDLSVCFKLVSSGIGYIHTHRYFSDFVNFWLNFFQLQDVLTNMKNAVAGRQVSDTPVHGIRVLLKLDFGGSLSLVLPVHSLSDRAFVAQMDSLHINNNFLFSSQKVETARNSSECVENEHDCLLDVIHVECSNMSLHPAYRSTDSSVSLSSDLSKAAIFDHYYMVKEKANILDKTFDLAVVIERNLDGALAKTVPDLAIYTQLSSLKLRITQDIYKLVRGFLDHNLGDPLPPVNPTPEFWPLPRNTPVPDVSVWTGLSFQLELDKIMLDCLWPVGSAWKPLVLVDLNQAKLSFESFSDETQELDLICERVSLVDTRFQDVAANKRPNSFDQMVCSCNQTFNTSVKPRRLMAEIHFLSGKDQTPKLTILLSEMRVNCLLDWLTATKDFILTTQEFNPPDPKTKNSCYNVDTPTPGVLTRVVSTVPLEQSVSLKLNLRECDLVFLEDASSRSSLALILKTTWVLHMDTDSNGALSCRLNAQAVQLSSCVMATCDQSVCQLTNQFTVAVDLVPQQKTSSLLSNALRSQMPAGGGGLLAVESILHRLDINMSELIARLSYRDWLMCHAIVTGYNVHWDEYWSSDPCDQPKNSTPSPDTTVFIDKLCLKAQSFGVWLLDDFENTRFPLIRFSFSHFDMDHFLAKEPADGFGSFELKCDYFNQRIYGWEPLIDPWLPDLMSWSYYSNRNKLQLQLQSTKSVLDINFTKVFLQQMSHFLERWSDVRQSLDADFRTLSSRSRHDHLPYLLKNNLGIRLRFTTDPVRIAEKSTVRWHECQPGQSVSFEFSNRNLLCKDDDSPNQLVLKVDGWHEISPVSVDCVGTYFRLVRIASGSASSSLSCGASSARIVIVVTMDENGRKVVTVRSALLLVNSLPDPLEVRLENMTTFVGDTKDIQIAPSSWCPAPLRYAVSRIRARPIERWSVEHCNVINWQHVCRKGETDSYTRNCEATGGSVRPTCYRMSIHVKREHYPEEEKGGDDTLPGHTITFLPPLTIFNLLPVEMSWSLPDTKFQACIPAGKFLSLSVVDISSNINFNLSTDTFRTNETMTIPEGLAEEKEFTLPLIDGNNRTLLLYLLLTPVRGCAVKICVSSPFWLVNNSALPLIIQQEGCTELAAGQFTEHEQARNKVPLMFSFAENDCPRQCLLRVGKLHSAGENYRPEWSRKFPLRPGITSRKLVMTNSSGFRPTIEYSIGIEVRQGQGLYKNTTIVFLTAQFQLDNSSSYSLVVAQKHDINNKARHAVVHPKCNFVWHWSKTDEQLLLCLKRFDLKYWSSGFEINRLRSFHLNMRDKDNTPHFLRIEILMLGSIYYVTISDAETFPPPMRIENHSEVPLLYRQLGCNENHHRAVLQPQTTVDYSMDDILLPNIIQLTAFESKTLDYNMTNIGRAEPLIYENYFFVRLVASFNNANWVSTDEQELVLETLKGGKVILNRMDKNRQCQLWRMSAAGCLENIEHCQINASSGVPYVMDVVGGPTTTGEWRPLIVRRLDTKRKQTQKWSFSKDGRLHCDVPGVFVQPQDGKLAAEVTVMLGPTRSVSDVTPGGIPLEQRFEKRHQKAGSGQLSVAIDHKGPTRVLQVLDMARPHPTIMKSTGRQEGNKSRLDLEMIIHLQDGLGFSLVNSVPEELVYGRLSGIVLRCERQGGQYVVKMEVMQIQADNQLLKAENWHLFYCKAKHNDDDDTNRDNAHTIPALLLEMQWTPFPNYDHFECFRAQVRKTSLKLEELFLWKLVQFLHLGSEKSLVSSNEIHSPNLCLERPEPLKTRRCYFGHLQLECDLLYLSVLTVPSTSLPADLRLIKHAWNVPLVRFENAPVNIGKFQQLYYFETFDFLIDAIQKHFALGLRGQAMKILGTVDFLGNPIGLLEDFSGGVQELLFEGNVGGLVTGIGHGVTNTVAKISSSLSDGVGKLASDRQHEINRMKARGIYSPAAQGGSAALGHLYGGVKGLGVGILGGATSLIGGAIEGAKEGGGSGLIYGISKGLIGTVTKPVQGVLDFTTGTASAAKEAVGGSTARKARFPTTRIRPPRCTKSLEGTLPSYSHDLAGAQQILLSINDNNTNEICLSVDVCCHLNLARLLILICTEQCFVVRNTPEEQRVMLGVHYRNLQGITVVQNKDGHYCLEVRQRSDTDAPRATQIRCNTKENAEQLCRKMLFAKQQHDDTKRSLAIVEEVLVDFLP